jgi:hypothetical protein
LAESAFGRVWSLESGGLFCVVVFSVAVKTFSHSVYFIKRFYKCFTSKTIYKNYAAINCISLWFNTEQVNSCKLV